MNQDHPFAALGPETVIDAVESTGLISDLRTLALNSYENRVYQVGVEDGQPVIAKFYRPERWSDAQILEEHHYCAQLVEAEVPVVGPWANAAGETLFCHAGYRFALYERRGGRAPALDDFEHLFQLGRLVARIHRVGALESFQSRPLLDVQGFGADSVEFLLRNFVPADLRIPYETLARDLLQRIADRWSSVAATLVRVHGDCHVGNILWRDGLPHFVDLDDSRSAPALQDLWMFLSGERDAQCRQLSELVEGYEEFREFDVREIPLVEILRTLRIMHYSAWLGRRWTDPAFPMNFPWFNTGRYWSDHILELREQLALLDEAPLQLL